MNNGHSEKMTVASTNSKPEWLYGNNVTCYGHKWDCWGNNSYCFIVLTCHHNDSGLLRLFQRTFCWDNKVIFSVPLRSIWVMVWLADDGFESGSAGFS